MIPKKPPPHRRGIGADCPLGGGSSNLADAASHLLGLAAGTGSSLPSDGADAASHLLCLAAGKGSSLPFDGVDSPGDDDDLFNYSSDSNKDDDGSMIDGYVNAAQGMHDSFSLLYFQRTHTLSAKRTVDSAYKTKTLMSQVMVNHLIPRMRMMMGRETCSVS